MLRYEHFSITIKNDVFLQLNNLYGKGTDPSGEEGQELAKNWWSMGEQFTAGDGELPKSLFCVGMDIKNWTEETRDFKEAIENFLVKALDVY